MKSKILFAQYFYAICFFPSRPDKKLSNIRNEQKKLQPRRLTMCTTLEAQEFFLNIYLIYPDCHSITSICGSEQIKLI